VTAPRKSHPAAAHPAVAVDAFAERFARIAAEALRMGGRDAAAAVAIADAAVGDDAELVRWIVGKDYQAAGLAVRVSVTLNAVRALLARLRAAAARIDAQMTGDDAGAAVTHLPLRAVEDLPPRRSPLLEMAIVRGHAAVNRNLAGQAAVTRIAADSILDTILVDGRPLRFATKIACLNAAHRHRHLARFLPALVHGLPREDSILGQHVDDQTAERIWRTTGEEI